MKIKRFNETKKEKEEIEISFDIKSFEGDKDEKPPFKTSLEDQEKIQKEFEKELDKIEKFESFITINIDDEDFGDEFGDSEESKIAGCGCCTICSGEEGCNCCEKCICSGDNNVKSASKFVNTQLSENLKWHLDNKRPVTMNIFRPTSKAFFELIAEARELYNSNKIELLSEDKGLFESTDIGNFGWFDGELVPIDLPMVTNFEIYESKYGGKKVKLNKPMRSSGPKKYKVYVKNPKTGKIIKVNFGDLKGGLTSKIGDPEARRRFDKRHGCSVGKHEDKTKAGYWSCRLPRYAKLLGLSQVSAKWW